MFTSWVKKKEKKHSQSTMIVTQSRNVLVFLFVRVNVKLLSVFTTNLLVNSIRTSRDQIQYHDKKQNNIEHNFAKTSKGNAVWRLSWNCGYVLFRFNCIVENIKMCF